MAHLRKALLATSVVLGLACGGGRSDASSPAGEGGGSDGAGDSGSEACSSTLVANDGEYRFEESCARDGRAASRTCTRGPADTAWACTCEAPGREPATCSAPAEPGVITAPPQCCPAG